MSWLENAINNQIKNMPEVNQSQNVKISDKNPIVKLSEGKVFEGEIVDVSGKNVTMRLENGQTVQARLQENYQFNIGQKVSFEIKANNGTTVEIRPVITGEQGADIAALKALKQAGIVVNEKTLQLLKALMSEQMPIDKNSLSNMYKLMLSNDGTDVATLAALTKNNIPVTKENINQYENYVNFQHQISVCAADISRELPGIMNELVMCEDMCASQFHADLLELVNGHNITGDAANNMSDINNGFMKPNGLYNEASMQMAEYDVNAQNVLQHLETGVKTHIDGQKQIYEVNNVENNQILKDESVLENVLSKSEYDLLLSSLKEAGIDENKLTFLNEGKATVSEFFLEVNKFVNEGYDLSHLMKNPVYHKLFSNQLLNNFLMNPEDIFVKENVERYYSDLREQMTKITSMLASVGHESSVAAKQSAGIRENIDFMNQINMLFTYVQLPLKMAGDSAHGDLYVFTNKRNLKQNKEKISALLHLDMQMLGSMDIYVELEKNSVRADFRMEDQKKIDFVKENIDVLVERLQNRGYEVTTDFNINEKNEEEFKQFVSTSPSLVQRFSFDVRA